MSESSTLPAPPSLDPGPASLKIYRDPWKGHLVLACGKCQRKLKHSSDHRAVARLKKSLKRIARAHAVAPITVLKVPCLKLCPKGGVTVCFGKQLQRSECAIVRTPADLDLLCQELSSDSGIPAQPKLVRSA